RHVVQRRDRVAVPKGMRLDADPPRMSEAALGLFNRRGGARVEKNPAYELVRMGGEHPFHRLVVRRGIDGGAFTQKRDAPGPTYRAAVEDPPQPRGASLERAAHRLAERKPCFADVQRIG